MLRYSNIVVGRCGSLSAPGLGLACTSAPARSFKPVVVYSLGVNPLHSTRFTPPRQARSLFLWRARDGALSAPRGAARRRAESNRVGSSRAERCRAVPSAGVERSRRPRGWSRRARGAAHRRSVCVRACAFCPLTLLARFLLARTLLRSIAARARGTRVVIVSARVVSVNVAPSSSSSLSDASAPGLIFLACVRRVLPDWPARAWTTRAHEPTRI